MLDVDLGSRVAGWFTGRGVGAPAVGQAGNLSSRRPHQPDRLAHDRRSAFGRHGLDHREVHLMQQVHGTTVTRVTPSMAPGRVAPATDALVTALPGRALAVLTADCLPVILAGRQVVAVAHAGRAGLFAGILDATVDACLAMGEDPTDLRAVIGPSIHACCYEVPDTMREHAARAHPSAAGQTSWGTPSLDLPAAASDVLRGWDVAVEVVSICTRCHSDEWFSHRADPAAGRQAGVVVRLPSPGGGVSP